jgi:putative CocE/NonD family hydrolase
MNRQIAPRARPMLHALAVLLLLAVAPPPSYAREPETPLAQRYRKHEVMIPMRDGARLFTAIFVPRDAGSSYPILMRRTPYSCRPYGRDRFPDRIGPSAAAERDGFIFVVQDVRGRFLSDGEFVNVRPGRQASGDAFDESTDTYDTIEWLLANVAGNNGKVGLYGISYPGFYAAAGMIDAHPALAASSPQAPIEDWFFDDFFHHGAFFLPHFFNFNATFGLPRPTPTTEWAPGFEHGTRDGYRFFLELGPLVNMDRTHYRGSVAFVHDVFAHPTRDEFWQQRALGPRLKDVAPAVLTVGGWYDAEDLHGVLEVYRAIERNEPGIENALVMGPWVHGGWARGKGDRLGAIDFGSATAEHYQEHIELPFFRQHLKGATGRTPREAYVFETGANRWHELDAWPPSDAVPGVLHLAAGGKLAPAPDAQRSAATYPSDPRRPVPYSRKITTRMERDYMVEDQRFAERRLDVLTFRGEPLESDFTLAGPLAAELLVATTQGDADFVVKLIDEFPVDAQDPPWLVEGDHLGGAQIMVRSEVFRGRYRDGYATAKPFVKDEPSRVVVPLEDVFHTFRRGHRVVVQVQSTWFPLVDRNPQRFVENVFFATEDDFVPAVHTLFLGGDDGCRLSFLRRPPETQARSP